MRFLTVILFLSLCGSAAAQQGKGVEAEFLNQLAGAAGAKSVTEAVPGALPPGEPLKVFVLAPEQADLWYRFQEWAEEWNRAEGGRYGRIAVVKDPSRAEVFVARFLSPFKTKSEQSFEVMGSAGSVPAPPGRGPGGVTMTRHAWRVWRSAKVFGYIAAREGEGLRLLWRVTDTARDNPTARRLPLRPGQVKGDKDSEIAGDGLRDQLFKLLRARGRPRDE